MNSKIIQLLDKLTVTEGFNRTLVDQVMLYRSETPIHSATLMYDPLHRDCGSTIQDGLSWR